MSALQSSSSNLGPLYSTRSFTYDLHVIWGPADVFLVLPVFGIRVWGYFRVGFLGLINVILGPLCYGGEGGGGGYLVISGARGSL